MDPLHRSLSLRPRQAALSAWQVLAVILGLMALAAAIGFRWRVFMAGSRYIIILIVILVILIWIGRAANRNN